MNDHFPPQKDSNARLERSITLSNDVQEVPLLAEFIDGVCEFLGVDMGTTMQLNLAMEEAVVNVMNYAYPKGTKGDVKILAHCDNAQLTFVIIDSGVAFDPTAAAEADTSLTVEERPIGGLGIFLVRQIMDEVEYQRSEGQNMLTMRKQLK